MLGMFHVVFSNAKIGNSCVDAAEGLNLFLHQTSLVQILHRRTSTNRHLFEFILKGPFTGQLASVIVIVEHSFDRQGRLSIQAHLSTIKLC